MSSATSSKGSTGSAASKGAPAGALTLLIGAALSGFDGGAIGFVLPAMRTATGADAQAASWLVSVFVAGTLAAIAASGIAASRFGARRLFALCLVLSAVAAALATLAPNLPLLLAARLLQGLAQGPLLPLAAAIVAVTWPAERAGRMLGALSLVYGLSFVIAMVATPALLHAAGWRAAFAVSCILTLAALVAMYKTRAAAQRPEQSSARGAISGATSGATLGATIDKPSARPPAPPAPAALARLLANRPMAAIALLSLGTGIGQAVLVWFPTLAIARLQVAGSSTTTLLMLPLAAGGIAATVLITAAMDRTGARSLLGAGALMTLAGVLLAAALPPSQAAFMFGAGLLGLGITGLCGGPLRYAAAQAVPARGQGLAQSAVALLTNVGLLAGSMLLGWLAVRQADERAAIESALLFATASMAALFVPVILLPGRRAARANQPLENA